MKMREAARMLSGGWIVYVAMAACSAGGQTPVGSTGNHAGTGGAPGTGGFGHGGHGGSSGVSGNGGAVQAGSGGDDAGIWDALTDPVPDAAAEPTSGSRLKAKYRLADDGAKAYLPYIWYDSQLGVDCFFGVAADGTERCLPSDRANAFINAYYSDAGCTTPLAYSANVCPPKYLFSTEVASCQENLSKQHVYAAGPKVVQAMVYSKSGNSCVGGAPIPSFTYYSVGAEVPASAFVGSSVMHD